MGSINPYILNISQWVDATTAEMSWPNRSPSGGVAGALAALTVLPDTGQVSKEQLLGIAAAGYAGARILMRLLVRRAKRREGDNLLLEKFRTSPLYLYPPLLFRQFG